MRRYLAPSFFVRSSSGHRTWTLLCRCNRCNLVGHMDDLHIATPCPSCGAELEETIGRWAELPRPWWAFWRWFENKGRWIIRDELPPMHPSCRCVVKDGPWA